MPTTLDPDLSEFLTFIHIADSMSNRILFCCPTISLQTSPPKLPAPTETTTFLLLHAHNSHLKAFIHAIKQNEISGPAPANPRTLAGKVEAADFIVRVEKRDERLPLVVYLVADEEAFVELSRNGNAVGSFRGLFEEKEDERATLECAEHENMWQVCIYLRTSSNENNGSDEELKTMRELDDVFDGRVEDASESDRGNMLELADPFKVRDTRGV